MLQETRKMLYSGILLNHTMALVAASRGNSIIYYKIY